MSASTDLTLRSAMQAVTGNSRELARIERYADNQVARVEAAGRIVEAGQRSAVRALEATTIEAITAAGSITRAAGLMAQSVPGSEHVISPIVAAGASGLAQVVQDTARKVR